MASMSSDRAASLPKRFYERAAYAETEGGFALMLDGRTARTPAKNRLIVSREAVAAALAEEWNAQEIVIDPAIMPLTRLVNSAIDGVARDPLPVREEIVRYAGTDMLCYRAADPQKLVAIQNRLWSPLIRWIDQTYGTRFLLAEGVMHVEQFPETLAAFDAALGDPDMLELAALSVVTTLTGSAILALALRDGRVDLDEAWTVAHADEDFEISLWGEDDEAMIRRAIRYKEIEAAALLLESSVT